MSRIPFSILLLAAAGCATAPPLADHEWSFTLDGAPLGTGMLSLEGRDHLPAPGDLIPVGPWLVPLEEPGPHRFEIVREDGLFLRGEDGSPRRIGLVLDGAGLAIMAAMTDAEAKVLRCVRIVDGSEEGARQVARLDGERIAVVFAPAGREVALPPLPAALRWLSVEEGDSDRVGSLDALAGLRHLRFLRVRRYAKGEDFDARLVAGMQDLARLDLPDQDIAGEDLLGGLASLRALRLPRCDVPWISGERPALSIHFVRRLGRLRFLDVSGSTAAYLAVLGGHPSLEEVRADGLRGAALPTVPMPALLRIHLVGTSVPPEGLAAIRATNPGAAVSTSWKEALEEAVAGADRVVLRTGGVCHRSPDQEKVLLESADPETVRRVLASIAVEDGAGGMGCMCCGHPTIEFRRGDAVLAELSMHHAARLRCPGVWPGDGALTLESIDALARWMAENGASEPLAEWDRERAKALAGRARWTLVRERVPASVAALLDKGTDREGLASAFREALPDPVARAAACLRIYGVGEGTWIKPWFTDFLVEGDLLPEIPPEALREALRTVATDPDLADGAARWLIEERRLADLDAGTAIRVLPIVGERALRHPRAYNRRRTLEVLGNRAAEEATLLLRRFVRGEFPPRPLDGVLVEEPFRGFLPPATGEVYAEFSDRAYAAVLLARRGDRDCLPEIRTLREAAPEEDREILDEALRLLDR